MYIPRYLDVLSCLQQKSLFLFGPRQTGKTSLVHKTLGNFRVYDLLDSDIYMTLSREPKRLEQELRPNEKILVIDEIQKLPSLPEVWTNSHIFSEIEAISCGLPVHSTSYRSGRRNLSRVQGLISFKSSQRRLAA
jgi:AAA+ ATPase superfamily predicted ATPase